MTYWTLVVIAAALTSGLAYAVGNREKPINVAAFRIRPHVAEGMFVFVGVILTTLITNHYQALDSRRAEDNLRGMIATESEKVHSLMQVIAQALRDLRASNPDELPLTIAVFEDAVVRDYGPLPKASGPEQSESGEPQVSPKQDAVGGVATKRGPHATVRQQNSERPDKDLTPTMVSDNGPTESTHAEVRNSHGEATNGREQVKAGNPSPDGPVTVRAHAKLHVTFDLGLPKTNSIERFFARSFRGYLSKHPEGTSWPLIPYAKGVQIVNSLNSVGLLLPKETGDPTRSATNIACGLRIMTDSREGSGVTLYFCEDPSLYIFDGTLLGVPRDLGTSIQQVIQSTEK